MVRRSCAASRWRSGFGGWWRSAIPIIARRSNGRLTKSFDAADDLAMCAADDRAFDADDRAMCACVRPRVASAVRYPWRGGAMRFGVVQSIPVLDRTQPSV